MARPRLHLDADTSIRALYQTLHTYGHDITRTPNAWIAQNADDETQLLRASAQGRAIFTFNIRDFMHLAQIHPQHQGIILAAQSSWSLSALIKALDKFLSSTRANDCIAQIFWLNHWRT